MSICFLKRACLQALLFVSACGAPVKPATNTTAGNGNSLNATFDPGFTATSPNAANSVQVTFSGETLGVNGLPFKPVNPGDPVFVDGWSIEFTEILLVVGNIRLTANAAQSQLQQDLGNVVAQKTGPYVLDMHRPSGFIGADGVEPAGGMFVWQGQDNGQAFDTSARYGFSYDLVNATYPATQVNLRQSQFADYNRMVQNHWSKYIVGSATYVGTGRVTDPTIQAKFDAIPQIVNFAMGWSTPGGILDCINPDLGSGDGDDLTNRGIQTNTNGTCDRCAGLFPQRGDGILQSYQAFTTGARSSYRLHGSWLGNEQALELGFYARYDHTTPQIDRVRFATQIPYSTDEALTTDVFNLAGFIDADFHPWSWLSLRGGVRTEFFDYNILNRCATAGNYERNQPLNQTCPAYDRSGAREPTQRATATGLLLEPKVTALAQLAYGMSLTGSFGTGAQSMDAVYISAEENAPFAKLTAAEGGILYTDTWEGWALTGRAVGFYTHVSQDLLFNPQLGRLSAAPGTSRRGTVVAARGTHRHFDELASVTYANATYDDTHALVPYVPIVIARSDSVFSMPVPEVRLADHPFVGTLGLGINLIGRRPLPLGQATATTLELDGSASLQWYLLSLGVRLTNILGTQYPLSQFFYASDFHSRLYPTLVPAAHFTAAAPRTVMVVLAIALDEES